MYKRKLFGYIRKLSVLKTYSPESYKLARIE